MCPANTCHGGKLLFQALDSFCSFFFTGIVESKPKNGCLLHSYRIQGETSVGQRSRAIYVLKLISLQNIPHASFLTEDGLGKDPEENKFTVLYIR